VSKKGIQLHHESVSTTWVMDTEKVDDGLVMFGFEEHCLTDEQEQVFKTEQVLDKGDLFLIKVLIDETLESIQEEETE